uniref:STIL N-terminal domain-containing protein n=1 Tax=Amphimedon queenslandica TaxID=400682 RepID=A0A1X7UVB2_AMPQE
MYPVPLLSTPLSSNLTGALPLSVLQGRVRSGFLTVNETRRLVLLLGSDSHVCTVPLIGIWISDVSISHPLVWSMLLHFSHFPSLHKVNHNGSYLLLLTCRHDYQFLISI